MSNIIDKFDGEYAFLSNFYESPIKGDDGIAYPTVEHYFQAMKTLNKGQRQEIAAQDTPGKAKRLGRAVDLRSDWEAVKESYMYLALVQKFQDPELRQKLLATGNSTLIEGNTWKDTYWGVCDGVGLNRLGCTLMKVRDNIKSGQC